jgi:hypothetical protein
MAVGNLKSQWSPTKEDSGSNSRIIGGLRHVHMIIGMNRSFATNLATHNFNGTIANHLKQMKINMKPINNAPH